MIACEVKKAAKAIKLAPEHDWSGIPALVAKERAANNRAANNKHNGNGFDKRVDLEMLSSDIDETIKEEDNWLNSRRSCRLMRQSSNRSTTKQKRRSKASSKKGKKKPGRPKSRRKPKKSRKHKHPSALDLDTEEDVDVATTKNNGDEDNDNEDGIPPPVKDAPSMKEMLASKKDVCYDKKKSLYYWQCYGCSAESYLLNQTKCTLCFKNRMSFRLIFRFCTLKAVVVVFVSIF